MWILRRESSGSLEAVTFACPELFNLRLFDGMMAFLSWGVLLPFGATVARFCKHSQDTQDTQDTPWPK